MFSPSDGTDWMVRKSGIVVRYSQAQMEDLNYGGGVSDLSVHNKEYRQFTLDVCIFKSTCMYSFSCTAKKDRSMI